MNETNFYKELQLLVKMRVLNPVQQYQYGTTVFITPNKEGTVRLITDYHKFNHQLVRKLYPLPRIGETIKQL